MQYRLDCHTHSDASFDGRMSVEELIAGAKRQGLNGLAVTDHDVLFTGAEVYCTEDFLLIPGEEFSTEYGHLVGLFLHEPIAFARQPGRAVDAPGGFASLCAAIHAQGGLAVLAHPFEKAPSDAEIEQLLPHLDGIESFNARATCKHRNANERAAAFAKAHGLACFAGSDAHVPEEIGNGWLRLEAADLRPETVKSALLRKNNPVGGREARLLDSARSQHTKLRKRRAGPLRRLKWLAYAGKCLLLDLIRKRRVITDGTAPAKT